MMQMTSWEQLPPVLARELENFISEWEPNIQQVNRLMHLLVTRQGRVCESEQSLLETLCLNERIGAEMERLLVYAQLLVEIEGSNEEFLNYALQAETLLADIQSNTEFVVQEIRASDLDVANYEFFCKSVRAEEPEEGDALVSSLQELSSQLEQTHRALLTTESLFEQVPDEAGVYHEVTIGNFRTLLGSTNRVFRERVYRSVYDTLHRFRKTFATNLHVQVRKESLAVDTSETDSLFRKALQREGLAEAVYQTFLETVHDHAFLNHRYYWLAARSLQLESIAPYDQYVTKNGQENPKIQLEEAVQLLADAFAFLGESYQQDVLDVLQRVIVTPHMSNYTVNVYTERPVIAIQFQGTLSCLLALAHEVGHAVHLLRANARQSFLYTDVPHVASEMIALLHEIIVLQHLRDHPLCGSWKQHVEFLTVDHYRYQLFKSTMLFEFERTLHQAVQEDQILTASLLCDAYAGLLRAYNGASYVVDDRISLDWIRVLHLYSPYYLAAYPLSFALADQVAHSLRRDSTMIERYFSFLESGCSVAPAELFSMIGVNLEDKNMYVAAFKTFELLLELYFQSDVK